MTSPVADITTISAPPRDYFPRIEGLRALAALSVFFTHVGATKYAVGYEVEGFDNVVRAVLDELTLGVQIFFGISGFVLFRPFVQRHALGAPPLRGSGYGVRRALRIYPAYWVALLGSMLILPDIIKIRGGWNWLLNLTLVQSYTTEGRFGATFGGLLHAWTLVVEITFYTFLGFLAVAIRAGARRSDPIRASYVGVGVVVALTVGAYVWEHLGHAPQWIDVLPLNLPLFLVGMLLAVASVEADRQGRWPAPFAFLGRHSAIPAMLAFAAFAALSAANTQGPPHWAAVLVLQLVVVASLLVLATVPVERPGRVQRSLSSRPAVFLGTVSYGLYLWHYAIVIWLGTNWFDATQGQTMVKVTVVALPVSVALAWLSYRCIEQPAIRLGRRLTR